MRRVKKLILALSLITILFSCGADKKKSVKQDLTIEVINPQNEEIESIQEFPFISKPFRTSELSFRVGGTISKFDLFCGSFYKKGELIAQIDPRDFSIKKSRAEAIFQQAKSEFERIENLFRKNNISASIFEKAKSDYATAKANYETATNELNDTKLIAPFNGYVGEIYIDKFQDIKATQPIISFIETCKLKIEVYIPQKIALTVKKGDFCEIAFDAMPEQYFSAKIEEVSKNTTKNNLSYKLTAIVDNRDYNLLSGMSGEIYFKTALEINSLVVTVPQSAICHRPTVGNYVWLVDKSSSKVSLQKVEIGTITKNGVTIVNGLTTNDIIAISGLRFLSEGMIIKIKNKL